MNKLKTALTSFGVVASLAAMLSFSVPNEAQAAWRVDAEAYVYPTVVKVQVINHHRRPIECAGKVRGVTRSGHRVWQQGQGVIHPGHFVYMNVYTDRRNPFVRGWGDIRCRWH